MYIRNCKLKKKNSKITRQSPILLCTKIWGKKYSSHAFRFYVWCYEFLFLFICCFTFLLLCSDKIPDKSTGRNALYYSIHISKGSRRYTLILRSNFVRIWRGFYCSTLWLFFMDRYLWIKKYNLRRALAHELIIDLNE